jgi:hypothetical protein
LSLNNNARMFEIIESKLSAKGEDYIAIIFSVHASLLLDFKKKRNSVQSMNQHLNYAVRDDGFKLPCKTRNVMQSKTHLHVSLEPTSTLSVKIEKL